MSATKRTKSVWIAIVSGALLCISSSAYALFINEDVKQTFVDPQDNFEIVIKGNATGATGQINAFPNGNAMGKSFDGTNTTLSFSGDAIAQNTTKFQHFGYTLPGAQFGFGSVSESEHVLKKYWTRSTALTAEIPALSLTFDFFLSTGDVLVTLGNLSQDTFSVFDVGFLVTSTEIPLADLNRVTLPANSFTPGGIPDGTQLVPNSSDAFNIPGVGVHNFVTVFVDAQFSGPSSGNPYTDFMGTFAEFAAVPEPSTLPLLMLGVAGIAGLRRRISAE